METTLFAQVRTAGSTATVGVTSSFAAGEGLEAIAGAAGSRMVDGSVGLFAMIILLAKCIYLQLPK